MNRGEPSDPPQGIVQGPEILGKVITFLGGSLSTWAGEIYVQSISLITSSCIWRCYSSNEINAGMTGLVKGVQALTTETCASLCCKLTLALSALGLRRWAGLPSTIRHTPAQHLDALRSRCQPGRGPSVLCMNYYRHLRGTFLEFLVVIEFVNNQFAPKSSYSFPLACGDIVPVQIIKWTFLSEVRQGLLPSLSGASPRILFIYAICNLHWGNSALRLEWRETIHMNFLYVAFFLHCFVKRKACGIFSIYPALQMWE